MLGTNRNVGALHRKREKLLGKRIIYYKYDYATLFAKSKVDDINKSDMGQGLMPNDFYVIEVVPDLFLQLTMGHNPVSVTPYLTLSLKFEMLSEAEAFRETLISDNMRWSPTVRHICKDKY